MNSFLLVIVLCLGNDCQSYVADYGMSLNDCNLYFTDSGLESIDKKIDFLKASYYNSKDKDKIVFKGVDCQSTFIASR
jgi:hypothetical protein